MGVLRPPSVFSRGGSLLPSMYADGRSSDWYRCENACQLCWKFDAVLAEKRPEVLEECDAVYAKEAADAAAATANQKPQLWDMLTSGSAGAGRSAGSGEGRGGGSAVACLGDNDAAARKDGNDTVPGGGFSFGF